MEFVTNPSVRTTHLHPNSGWLQNQFVGTRGPQAAGAKPPVSHHMHLGTMTPAVMASKPSMDRGYSWGRGQWQCGSNEFDVPASRVAYGSPPAHHGRIHARSPIRREASETPPESQRSTPSSTPRAQASGYESPARQYAMPGRRHTESARYAPAPPDFWSRQMPHMGPGANWG